MKNHLILFSLLGLLATTGCETIPVDPQTIDDTAIILRNAARNGAIFAIDDEPKTKPWFVFTQVALSTFLTGKDFTPGAFEKVMQTVPVSEFKSKYVKVASGTLIDLYELYYGRYVKGKIANNPIALKFLTAIQDGFAQATK